MAVDARGSGPPGGSRLGGRIRGKVFLIGGEMSPPCVNWSPNIALVAFLVGEHGDVSSEVSTGDILLKLNPNGDVSCTFSFVPESPSFFFTGFTISIAFPSTPFLILPAGSSKTGGFCEPGNSAVSYWALPANSSAAPKRGTGILFHQLIRTLFLFFFRSRALRRCREMPSIMTTGPTILNGTMMMRFVVLGPSEWLDWVDKVRVGVSVETFVVAVGNAVAVNRTELDVDVVEDVGVAKDSPASATEDGQSS